MCDVPVLMVYKKASSSYVVVVDIFGGKSNHCLWFRLKWIMRNREYIYSVRHHFSYGGCAPLLESLM